MFNDSFGPILYCGWKYGGSCKANEEQFEIGPQESDVFPSKIVCLRPLGRNRFDQLFKSAQEIDWTDLPTALGVGHGLIWTMKSVIRGCHLERVADLPFIFSYGSCGSFADPHHGQEDHALFCFSIAFKDSCFKYQYNSFSKVQGQTNYEHFFTVRDSIDR